MTTWTPKVGDRVRFEHTAIQNKIRGKIIRVRDKDDVEIKSDNGNHYICARSQIRRLVKKKREEYWVCLCKKYYVAHKDISRVRIESKCTDCQVFKVRRVKDEN